MSNAKAAMTSLHDGTVWPFGLGASQVLEQGAKNVHYLVCHCGRDGEFTAYGYDGRGWFRAFGGDPSLNIAESDANRRGVDRYRNYLASIYMRAVAVVDDLRALVGQWFHN